jgi:tetratricopeptide (TPR) repeat protein
MGRWGAGSSRGGNSAKNLFKQTALRNGIHQDEAVKRRRAWGGLRGEGLEGKPLASKLDRHIAALAANPGDVRAFTALEEAYFLGGQWDALAALYRQRLALPDLPVEIRAPLHFRLGQVLEERCLEIDLAIEQYTRAIQLDSRYRAALRQLRQLHSNREAWDLVLQIAEIEIGLLEEPYERASFFAEMGDVWLRRMGDASEAMTCFEQALAIDPVQKEALAGLARTLEAQGNPEAAAATWERLIGCLRGPDRAAPLVALAGLLAGPLRQGERAVELYRRALGDYPRNENAVEALSMTASAREQWDLLADLYERRFRLASGARRRTAIALEAGTMQLDRVGNVEAARLWFERARELAGDDTAVLESFVNLERHAGSGDRLVAALDRLIASKGARTPVRLLIEAAGLHGVRGEHEQAQGHLEAALQHKPDHPGILAALAETYANLQRYEELAGVLERRAALAEGDPKARAAVLCELGQLQASRLADPEAAQEAYERAFAVDPSLPGLAATLEALYRKTESWASLRSLLERAVATGPEAERPSLQCSLGELLEAHFGDFAGSAACYEAALDAGPEPRGLQGLTRLAERSGDPDAMRRALEREAVSTSDPDRLAEIALELCVRYEDAGDARAALSWVERALKIRPLERQFLETAARLQEALGATGDLSRTLADLEDVLAGPEQAAVRRRVARLHEAAGSEDEAVVCWEAALGSEPHDLESLAALRRHYQARGRFEELAPVLRKLSELAPDEERPAHLEALARLLDEKLSDLDSAIVVLWRLSELPGRPVDAGARLASMLERAGRFEELAQQLLENRRGLPDQSPEALELDLRRAALLLDPLGQFEEAVHAFRAVRARAPERREATEGLERALRADNDTAGLARLLADLAEEAPEPARRDALLLERADLLEESLGELEQARQLYARLCTSGTSPETARRAGERLESLLERCGDWIALRARLEAAVPDVAEDERCALHERIATLCADRMADPEGTALHLEAAARLAPERAEPWRRLARVYQEQDRQVDLLRVMEAELATGPDPERERVLHARAAELWLSRPGEAADESKAEVHYERLLALDPGRADATQYLVDRYEEASRYADVVRLLEGRLEAVSSPPETPAERDPSRGLQISLRLRIATLRAEELRDESGAIAVLEPALADGGPAGPAAEPLADLYQLARRHSERSELCRAAALACPSGAERALWLSRQAASLRELGDDAGAAAAYREVLEEKPNDRDAHAALCDLHRRAGQAEPLAERLEASLAWASRKETIAIRQELAQLFAEALGRPADALAELERVLEISPEQSAAFDQALSLAGQLGRPDDQLVMIDRRLELRLAPDERARLLEQRADLLAGPLEAPDTAVSAYREVIALDPERRSARRSLGELLERMGRWTAVLDCLYVDAKGAEPDERSAIYERAVEVASANVGPDAALPWLERLRAVRPHDPLILARIADVHRLAGRSESVLRAIEDELEISTEPQRVRDLQVGRARILERDMRSPGRAIAALESARSLCPRDANVLEKLDELYALTGRAKDRADVIEARIANAGEQDPLALHLAVAELYCDMLSSPERAAPHLLRAVLLTRALTGGVAEGPISTPEARIALVETLARTLRSAGREEGWARASEAALTLIESALCERPARAGDDTRGARCHALRRDLAVAYSTSLADQPAALRHLRALMDVFRDEPVAGLSRDDLDHLECMLLDLLRADSNWVELASRLAARVERGGSGRARSVEWIELAWLLDERLHAPRAALDAFTQALGCDPDGPDALPAIRGMRDVAEWLASWPDVVRALELELAREESGTARARAALARRVGEICRFRLDDRERAVRAYTEALALDPQDLSALRSLEELHELRGEWSSAVALYEREAGLLEEREPERRKHAWLTVAELARRRTDEPERALRAFEEAARISPLDSEPLRAQAELYRRAGARERFAETWAAWCDAPRSDATAADHLGLARVLIELDRHDDALVRARRAVADDERSADAWATVAQLEQHHSRAVEAAEAWERAGLLGTGPEAAAQLCQAALLVESRDRETCLRRLRRAVEIDPASSHALAHRARAASAQSALAEAETCAGRALDLSAASDEPLDETLRLDTALVGGRAARAQDRLEPAIRFFEAAVALAPEHLEALEAVGELLFERGDLARARTALEARLALGDDLRRAARLAMLGSALELAGDPHALARFQDAVAEDAGCGAGHAGIARLCEKSGRVDEAVAALVGWAESARSGNDLEGAAARLCHAAEIELARDRGDAAEDYLRKSLSAAPDNARAWVLLCEILEDADRTHDVLDRTAAALSQDAVRRVEDAMARLSLLRARALERSGDPDAACTAYAQAVEHDPRGAEAALARARLQRARGEWQAAADGLHEFCEGHPEPDHRDLAEAHYKRARLLAGPLEDMQGAIQCFERALEVAPDHPKAREPLASLLAVMPERWKEAIVHHAALLEERPTRSGSFRALVQIAQRRGRTETARFGLAILRAIGSASPGESSEAPALLPRPIVSVPALEDPIGEIARRLLQQAAEGLEQVLGAPEESNDGDFPSLLRQAEREVCAAGLERLSDPELEGLLGTVAALALGEGPESEGPESGLAPDVARGLERALGRWSRRKLRRTLDGTSAQQIAAIDVASWRVAVAGLAAAVAVDRNQGDLRTALVALCGHAGGWASGDGEAPGERIDLCTRIAGSPFANELVRRVAASWCQELIRG